MERDRLIELLLETMQHIARNAFQKKISETSQGEAFMLIFLDDTARPVLPGEISETMSISSARTAAALKGLEKKGLIRRQINPQDRRQILVTLTEKGVLEAESIRRFQLEIVSKLLDDLGEADAMELVRISRRIRDIHGQRGVDCCAGDSTRTQPTMQEETQC